ncbi:MAG TPA: TonB-dependent receptor [Tepidisphaeraceae bacterium]|nr:TonB-dependent receptor [Tepidisphaeraceae bacterium]
MEFGKKRSATLSTTLFSIASLLAVCGSTSGQTKPSESTPELVNMSLEDLMNVEVTSVSKTKQRIADAPAAVYVIAQEDIHRSGISNIPELLRMVPGMDVARVNGSEWAISSRGFNDIYANKLLVLMDGRAVYTPLFGGVFWSQIDYLAADLNRIEGIRGPGATLWGANAVNGVVNITSKTANETQGAIFKTRVSNENTATAFRYGGKLDPETYYRVYGKYRTIDNQTFANGDDAHDGWDSFTSGFRIDRNPSSDNTYTLQGDVFSNRAGQTLNKPLFTPPFSKSIFPTFDESGGNLLGRWTHKNGDDSEFSLQAYVDRFYRAAPPAKVDQNTFDIEAQHDFQLSPNHHLTWGIGYRFVSDAVENSDNVFTDPTHRDAHQANLFAHDKITLQSERLYLFLGSKLEANTYSGLEVEPGARLLWTPNKQHSIWGAVSQAVRTPARVDENISSSFAMLPTQTLPLLLSSKPNPGLESEHLTAFELGYRFQPNKRFSFDVSTFFNQYDDLIGYTSGDPITVDPSPIPHLNQQIRAHNALYGETYGAEVSGTLGITDNWRISTSYSFLQASIHHHGSAISGQEDSIQGSSPRNQFQIRSYYDITRNLELNVSAYYMDNTPAWDVSAYWRLDAGVTWRPNENTELSIGIQNALDNHHPEFGGPSQTNLATEIPRTIYMQASWKF